MRSAAPKPFEDILVNAATLKELAKTGREAERLGVLGPERTEQLEEQMRRRAQRVLELLRKLPSLKNGHRP